MVFDDTIAAISSPVGPAARIILRLSGARSHEIGRILAGADLPAGASRRLLHFADLRAPAWIYVFAAPRSYSGQDMLELHIPGNPLLARMLLDELVRLGARQAEAGEFTARAYFSGRLDLTEAEGVAATIAARGDRELVAARQLLTGELARRLRPTMDQLAETLALVEAGIDFSQEDITFLTPQQLAGRIETVDASLQALVRDSARFEQLAHEPQVVLAGRPNAGKSTMLNALAGTERAVVSPIAGTTRDLIWAEVALGRGMVRIIDAAGLDEAQPDPADTIACQMRQRAMHAVESADVLLYLREAGDNRPQLALPREPDRVVVTKADLDTSGESLSRGIPTNLPPSTASDSDSSAYVGTTLIISARTGRNMDRLRAEIQSLAFGREGDATLALNARHLRALDDAREALGRARAASSSAGVEVLAMELREALDALGHILGQVTPDDVIGRVFATFCVGK